MATVKLTINNQFHTFDVDPKMPLLWTIRDVVGLTGTKFGCKEGRRPSGRLYRRPKSPYKTQAV